jgi:hypothetical protein
MRNQCNVTGCSHPVKGHGFCSKHYQRFKKGQDPHTTQDQHRNVCAVHGCSEYVKSRSLCQKHLQRKVKYGKDPHVVLPRDLDDAGKFRLRYQESDGCWEWKGRKDVKGYGQFTSRDNGVKHKRAHRMAYELKHGSITDNLLVCHKCDNPGCVNPDHLFLGTDSDNMVDMVKKNRHVPGKGNKLSPEDVLMIRNASNLTHSVLAEMFNTTRANIGMIVNRKTWKHI